MAVSASAPADLQLSGFVQHYMEAWNDCESTGSTNGRCATGASPTTVRSMT
jgi:hypothetical protein